MRVLLAYDASPASEAALDEVVRRPWPEGTKVRIVTVMEPPLLLGTSEALTDAFLVEQIRSSLREEARSRLQRAMARLTQRSDIHATSELREGSPKASLLEAIQEWKPDLVFTGSHGARGLERLFLGSVSHALVTHAPCNVEVVKVPNGPWAVRNEGTKRTAEGGPLP